MVGRASTATRDTPASNPTKLIWIAPYRGLSKNIKIFDVTSQFPVDQLEKQDIKLMTEQLEKIRTEQIPIYTISREGAFKHSWTVYEGLVTSETKLDTKDAIAHWEGCRWERGTSVFKFIPPPKKDAPEEEETSVPTTTQARPDHPVSMKRSAIMNYTESFVVDSYEYIWRWEHRNMNKIMGLYKKIGDQEVKVARFVGKPPTIRQRGSLAVDETEVDVVLALMSCIAMLRKDDSRGGG